MLQIKQATKKDAKLRLSLVGVSGSGKTFTSLAIAENLGGKILVVDTEHGSASKYADLFEFDVIELDQFVPDNFIEAIKLAEKNEYEIVILDSLSHAWMGKGGVLDLHGDAEKRTKNSFTAWKDVTPKQLALIDAIVQAKIHVIATMRAKTDYAMETENGKTKVKTVGLAPVQRDGMEYEFDVVAQLDIDNNFIVQKTRCPMLSGKVYQKAGANVAEVLKIWLQGERKTIVKMPQKPVETEAIQADAKEFCRQHNLFYAIGHFCRDCQADSERSLNKTIQAEPVFDAPPDYTDEWNAKLASPTVKKEVAPVSPSVKGKLLVERGCVARTNKGFEVKDEDHAEYYDVTRTNNKVNCVCADYTEGVARNASYRCAHIEAVKLFLVAKQPQAA